MLTQEHVESVRSYIAALFGVVLAFLPSLTETFQFLAAFVGFLVVAHRAWHDFKTVKDKKDQK